MKKELLDLNFKLVNESLFIVVILYLLIPSAIVLFYFGSWPIITIVSVMLSILWNISKFKRPSESLLALLFNTWPILLVAAGFVWLSGILPPFAETDDWYKHYAIFNTLVNQHWPPKVIISSGEGALRYYLSYYVIPAIVTKHIGSFFLSTAIFIWTVLGLYLVMLLAFNFKAKSGARVFFLCCIFLLFSGADIIGYAITHFKVLPTHLEWWAKFGSIDSTLTGLLWVPQHSISGWLATFLILCYPHSSIQNAGLIISAVVIWSPFSAFGLIPIFLWSISKVKLLQAFTFPNLVVAPILLASALLFLTEQSAKIPYGFIWESPDFSIKIWIIFLFLEFGALVFSLLLVFPQKYYLIIVNAAFLIFLSLFKFGQYNDLLMRASIPALGVFALLSSVAIICKPNDIRKIPIIVCFLAGLATPLVEIVHATTAKKIKDTDKLELIDIIELDKNIEAQYIVYGKYNSSLKEKPILDTADFKFTRFGSGAFNESSRRIESYNYTDAALVSQELSLPGGFYKLDALLDWDVAAKPLKKHGAHISLFAEKLLIPIMDSKAMDKSISLIFKTNGKPFKICFGLGGWSFGKGYIELKQLKVSSMTLE